MTIMTSRSLIETVRVRSGRAPLWHLHLRRLWPAAGRSASPFRWNSRCPPAGADRVHRSLWGVARGVQVNEREVGATVEPVRLVTLERRTALSS